MNTSSQHSNVVRNGVWEFTSKIFSLLTPFLIRTIIIWKFGVEYLGLNNLFASVLQILNVAELGFGEAVVYNLYKPIVEHDDPAVNALMGFYRKVYRIIGIIITGAGICIMPFLPHVISGEVPAGINIYALYAMSLTSTALSYLCFSYKSVLLMADQRKDINNKISLVCTFFKYGLQILILYVTYNFYLYFSVDIFATVLSNILIARFVKRNYPQFDEKGILDGEVKKKIFVKVKGLMVYKLSGKTKNAVDSVVLSGFLGLAVVGRYGNYYYILNNIVVLLTCITAGAQATIGNRMVINSEEKNYEDFMNLTFVHSWISGVCCVCLFCLYQHFMKLWVGESNMFPFYMVICFCVYFFFLSSCEARNAYINASGLWWENRFRAIGSAVANLFLNVILVQKMGILGIILATIISIVIFDFFFTSRTLFRYTFKNHSMLKYAGWWGKQIIVTMAACAVMYLACTFIHNEGILGFCIKGIMCVIGSNLMLWAVNRNDAGFVYMTKFIKRTLNR